MAGAASVTGAPWVLYTTEDKRRKQRTNKNIKKIEIGNEIICESLPDVKHVCTYT